MNNQLLKVFEGKRQKPTYSTVAIEGWILPSWFIKQSDPLSPGYVLGEGRFANLCYRNWTAFCNQTGEPVLLVDGDGTISFPKIGVSMEIWVNDGKQLFTPGRFLHAEQKGDPEFFCIETKCQFQNGFYKSLVFPIKGLPNHHVGLDLEVCAAGESVFRNFLVLLVVRPYDHNGLTAINRLEYKNKRLKVNNNELFQLATEPKIVFCTHAGLGDVTEYFKLEQNNYLVSSEDGSSTGFVGYLIRPADQSGIKLIFKPDSFAILSNHEKYFTQKWFCDSKQNWLNQFSLQRRMIKTGTGIDPILLQNFNYLKMFIGTSAGLIDIYNILALNRYAFFSQSRAWLIKTLKKVRWDGSLSNGYLNPGKLIYALADYYHFTGDPKIIADNWLLIKRMGYWLVQNQSSFAPGFVPERLEEQVWICASYKALSALSEVVGDYENSRIFRQHYQELWSGLFGFFSRETKKNSGNDFRRRPVSETLAILSLSYPLQLYQSNERFVREWLHWIMEKSTFNGGVVSPLEFNGADLKLTARIGEILLREGESYDPAFMFLSSTISSTGSWPDRAHPILGGGIGVTGHAPEVCCHFLLFFRNIMVMEEGETLYLLPGVFTSELWNGLDIDLNSVPTTFGDISLKCRNIGKIVQIEFNALYRKKPRQIMLKLNEYDRVIYSNASITRDEDNARMDPDFKMVRLRRGR